MKDFILIGGNLEVARSWVATDKVAKRPLVLIFYCFYLVTDICLMDFCVLINWTSPFQGCQVEFFIFILFLIENPVSKQCTS